MNIISRLGLGAMVLFMFCAHALAAVTSINSAEAILSVLWDPQTSDLDQWKIADGSAQGLKVTQGWSWVDMEWARKPASGPAMSMTRALDVDCSRYDRLMVCMNPGKGNALRVVAQTDAGERVGQFTGYPDARKEYFLDLAGAKRLSSVTIEITPAGSGVGMAWIQWVGLQSSQRLADVLAQYANYDPAWPKLLKPESYQPSFKPTYGIAVDAEDLIKLRGVQAKLKASGPTVFEKAAEHARKRAPESMIGRFNTYLGARTARDRDMDTQMLQSGVNAAIAGLVLEDKELLRLAARYALSIAACEYWEDGFVGYYPLSPWEQRPFLQSLAAHDVAMILDLAGEMFTDAGKDLLRRRLAEHGLGNMNYSYWKYDFIFDCNQAAWFSPGRFLAYSMLERSWPRVKPYLDLAVGDLQANLDRIVLDDGGTVEGPMYFRPIGRDAALAYYYLARNRQQPFLKTLPERMQKTADFAELVMTTTGDGDYIAYGDSYQREFPEFAKAALAAAMPDSAWGKILQKSLARQQGNAGVWPLNEPFRPSYLNSLSDVVVAWKLAQGAKPGKFVPRALVSLPETGLMASTRMVGEHPVKLLVIGNRAKAGHNHEDKGSFILEFAGEVFADDPILATAYGDPALAIGKQAHNHNLLVPAGTSARPAQLNPMPVDAKPTGIGDGKAFHASIDLTGGWPGFYKKWVRTYDSPSPDRLTITDDYELAQGSGVEFVWWTQRPVNVEGQAVTITGKHGSIVLQAPADTTIRVEPVLNGKYQRIAIARPGTAGKLQVSAVLQAQ